MRLVTCFALVLAACGVSPATAKEYRAQRYDVTLHLDRQGELTVTETVEFQFVGGPFHYVFRDLETRFTDGISDIHAAVEGPGHVGISNGARIHVRWDFEPVSDVSRTFSLSYIVAGTIQKTPSGDLFVWHPLPHERGYRIGHSRILVEYPSDLAPDAASLRHPDAQWETSPGAAVVELSALAPDRYPTIEMRFAAGAFLGPPPQWQTRSAGNSGDFVRGLFVGLAAGLLFAGLVALWGFGGANPGGENRRGFAGQLADDGNLRLQEAPDSLAPAVAATLIGRPYPAAGILIDLARRGVLRVDEASKSRFTGRRFRVSRLARGAQLAPYEQMFVDFGFDDGIMPVEMTLFASRTQRAGMKIRRAILRDLIERGLVDEAGNRLKTRLTAIGGLAVIIGPIALFSGLVGERGLISGVVAGVGAALALLGVATLVTASRVSRWTDAGAQVAARWRAFSRYLRDAARGRETTPLAADANRWLPYAAAFGVAAQLVRRRKKEGMALALPEWFAAFETGPDGTDAFAVFLGTSGADGGSAGGGGGADGGGGGASGAG